ncbi:MAG: methylenetetrahydrofolate dehydrogenase (NADP+)/methenyltetrahydrofolate cyclohydrolase [Gammaproteobacteria bacterium]|jgi:methylenetetrahydrofolate dehydrogenase (NADP+)/methenyltetrahydrofolate cyclohydrolase
MLGHPPHGHNAAREQSHSVAVVAEKRALSATPTPCKPAPDAVANVRLLDSPHCSPSELEEPVPQWPMIDYHEQTTMSTSTSTDAARIIDGKTFAGRLREQVRQKIDRLYTAHQLKPGLAVVLLGDDPASQIYVRNKAKQTVASGMQSFEHRLPSTTSEDSLVKLVRQLNDDSAVHGILVQLPLPPQIREAAVINTIDPAKDVDGFHISNAGLLATGGDALVPCTPLGCLMLLKERLGDLSGKPAIVLGRSNIVGKPMAQLLIRESCTVTVAHSRTRDAGAECRRAEIVIAAVGQPRMVPGDWLAPGATVIDVGINRIDVADGKTRLVGDVDFDNAIGHVAGITPVPGGVGPMTIACLLHNTVIAACRQHGIEPPPSPSP